VPQIGVKAAAGGGQPEVVVSSDVGLHMTRGFAFDPAGGFAELWSVEEPGRTLGGPPMLLSNRVAAVSLWTEKPTDWKVTIGGPDGAARPSIAAMSLAAPTLMSDGRIAVVGNGLHVARASGAVDRLFLDGRAYAPASASCTHLYVATTRKLLSFDRSTLTLVGDFPILGGGTTAPVIGPRGDLHVAIQAYNGRTLLMFWPGPEQPASGSAAARFCQGKGLVLPTTPFKVMPLQPF
jgi:hypothetical protein